MESHINNMPKGFQKGNNKWKLKKNFKHSENTKRNISKLNKGRIPWNKGKKTGLIPKTAFKKGQKGYWLGKKRPDISKKISDSLLGKTGEISRNWKGGIDIENRRIRQSLEYEVWRLEVYQRDHFTCRLCGKKCLVKDIVAHHIKLFSQFIELRFSIDNGITLCRSCHAKIHKTNANRPNPN